MVKRRAFLGAMGSAVAAGAVRAQTTTPAAVVSTAGLPPRKVIVGTLCQPFWVKHPGLEKRLEELTGVVGRMSAEARKKYGRGLDLAVLPETCLSGEAGRDVSEVAAPFEGAVSNAFGRAARELGCHIIVPMYLREAGEKRACSNACVVVGRKGELVGIYRKVHLVVGRDGKTMEGGCTPGRDLPVFNCDFGKLAIQICYDMEFDRGWQELARKGAELIAYSTQSPQTSHPAFRAMQQRCFIVSSTWRHNATVFEPTGKIVAQIREPERLLIQEIDLSYAILPWSSKLRHGKGMSERYGDRVGYRYYEDEDLGIFWSNDPSTPILKMVREMELTEAHESLARVREIYRRERVLDY